jgi:polyvinyl alcohol dehydrogenase (cytochrome)
MLCPMRHQGIWIAAALCVAVVTAVCGQSAQNAPAFDELKHPQGTNAGIYTFSDRCSKCHDNGVGGAPDRHALNGYTPEQVLTSMTTGSMAKYTDGLTDLQKRVIAVYVGGRPFGSFAEGDLKQMKNTCPAGQPWTVSKTAPWSQWGADISNTRYQPTPGLTADQVPRLKLKWAFGFPNANSGYGQPSYVDGRVFVGSDTGWIYAINAETGCAFWSFRANAGVRTPVVVSGVIKGRRLAFFGDIRANLYALDATTGKLVWTQRADLHRLARLTGAPVLHGSTLYVPISSLEESGAGNANYPCCTFRGALSAYNVTTGKLLWKTYTIDEPAKPTTVTSKGTQLYGPAGASLWSAPTLDLKRNAIYVATGNGYTMPAPDTSDAVMAFDLKTGHRLWANQLRAADGYVRDCPGKYRPNVPTANASETCPTPLGPDVDFGNSPILRKIPDGRTLIIIGQKDGNAWALDPDKKGAVVWQKLIGLGIDKGGGGMQWGSAADDTQAYFPLTRGGKGLGLAAVALGTGEITWRATPAIAGLAPVSVIPDVIFEGSNMGELYAYSTKDGKELWHYDTNRDFTTVNGVEAKGGGFGGAAGPIIAGGMVLTTSGNSDLFGGPLRGNVLLAFGPE